MESVEMRKKENTVLKGVLAPALIFLALGASLLFPSHSPAQNPGQATVFENVRVFDGENIMPACTVVIQDGKILAVGKDITVPEGAEKISGEGKTLLPGFFDAHVHVWNPQNLHQSLIFGVTTVVDMFMDVKTMADIKQKQSSGQAGSLAYLISAGTLATAPGGHGTQYGAEIPTLTKPEDAEAFVDARIDEGSDFIKIIYDDASAYGMSRPTVDNAIISALVEAAHKKGKLAIIRAGFL